MDVRTMAIMTGTVNVLLAVVLFAQYRFNKGFPGLGWWAAGQVAVAVGFAASTLRGSSFVGHVAVPVYQALLVLGTAFIYVGVLRFLGRKERWPWLVATWLVIVFWSTFHTFVDDNATLRAMGLYLALAVLLAASSVAMWRYRLPSVRGSATYLSIVFALTALCYVVLALAEPTRPQVENPFYAPSPVNAGAFLAAMAGTVLWTFGLVVMINQRLAAEIALDASNMRTIFATSPDSAILSRVADGVIRDVNEGFTRLSGYPRDEVIGRSTVELGLWADPSARDQLIGDVAAAGSLADFPMVFRRKDGSTLDCLVAASALRLDDEPYLMTVTRDVTQQRLLETELQREATTDSLTGLPNRRHFLSVCVGALHRTGRNGAPLSIAVVDIDHFKVINDTYGHAVGDAVLMAFAQAVTNRIRDVDIFGRLGGDEFGLLMPDTDLDQAVAVVDRVRADLSASPLLVGMDEIELAFSAGVAAAIGGDDTVDTVIARADKAVYAAKAEGRDRVQLVR